MNTVVRRGPSMRTRIALVATIGLLGAGISPVMSASAAPAISTVSKISKPTVALQYTNVRVGSTVGATVTKPSGVKVKYQWLRSGKAIKKATKIPYVLKAADRGKTISLKVTLSKKGQKTVSRTSAKTPKVQYGIVLGGTPTIEGALAVDNVVTVNQSVEWAPGVKVGVQWYADGVAISKATKSSLAIPGTAVGKYLSVKVTGKKSGFKTASYESAYTTAVTGGVIVPSIPILTGFSNVGSTMTLQQADWSPSTTKMSYQWLRFGVPITGATKTSYKLTAADLGTIVNLRVSGSRSGYLSATTYTLGVLVLPELLP